MMIDLRQAQAVAQELVSRFQAESGVILTVVDADTVAFDGGWIFYWDSVAFLQSGDFAEALGGNAPLVILKDGSVRQAPTAFGTKDEILRWLEENPDRGWLSRSPVAK